MPDRSSEPFITAQDLRAALAPQGAPRRPAALLSEPAGEWDWDPGLSDAERVELAELRSAVAHQREQLDELRRACDSATTHMHALRDALGSLAATRAWNRRAAIAALRARGLLDAAPVSAAIQPPAP
jgi:hypothetical protein